MHELDPELGDDEIDIVRDYGHECSYADGEYVWQAGDRGPFVLVLDGGIDVLRPGKDDEHLIISHGPRHYVGEIITMSGGRALVTGRAVGELKAIIVESDDLRRLIATESELGEKLLQSFILRRMRMVAERLSDIVLIGRTETPKAADLRSFLSRNGIPFETLHPDTDAAAVERSLAEHGLDDDALPAVVYNGKALVSPTNRELAEQLGFTADIDCGTTYDVAVIGSGPAGLAAAVYAASEGLSVIVLENCAPGGQAGSSSKIENYMGFPTGISGQALMGRAYLQAQKFGAQIGVARELLSFECGDPLHKLKIDGNDTLYARAVVIASGAVYRQPAIDRLDEVGGVHYGASYVEGETCRGQDVAIIGGGNSAGQAAVYLSKRARRVHILIRGAGLAASMSDYLIKRIDHISNIELHTHSEVHEIFGDAAIESLAVRDNRSGDIRSLDASHLFIFIGAQPGTGFISDQLALDDRGFVLTGDNLESDTLEKFGWPLERPPYLLETSCPRVFAAGDVRSGSIKRVASAVGEGSVSVQFIHQVLADHNDGAIS
ncbi:MAG: FAD-dependent oxidoreductase [Pseudomonadota bacterium]